MQREQLQDHEEMVLRLEAELEQHRRHTPERGAKALSQQNYKEKDAYLHYEVCKQQLILVAISASHTAYQLLYIQLEDTPARQPY